MLFVTWPEQADRPTGDLDLLGQGDPDPEAVRALFARICAVDAPEDGLVFDPATLRVEAVREVDRYQGVQLSLRAELAGAVIPVQVDIGFGDHVHPAPRHQVFPSLLPDLPAATLLMYPPETVIAEKFEAMIRFVAERLAETASAFRDAEGWKWAEAHLDYPYGLGLGRVYPQTVERSEVEASEIVALGVEYDAILSEWDGTEDWPAEVEARFNEIDAALKAFGDDFAYRPEDRARAGVIVALGADGQPRIERGLVRAEDAAPPPQAEDGEADAPGSGPSIEGDTDGPGGSVTVSGDGPDGEADEGLAPLSEKLVLDLTAWRTAGLRDAMASDPLFALTAVVHAMALEIFYPPYDKPTPLQFRLVQTGLERHAPGLGESAVGRRIADRHEGWATRLPKEATELWAAVLALPLEDQLVLLAHCASLGLNALRDPHDRRPAAWAQAEVMATALALDMATIWTPSIDRYLGRVSKARILEAVGEAASPPDAERMSGWKKSDMADAAELLLDGKGWLPPLLRTAPPTPPQADGSADASETEATDRPEPAADGNPTRPDDPDAYPFAAE